MSRRAQRARSVSRRGLCTYGEVSHNVCNSGQSQFRSMRGWRHSTAQRGRPLRSVVGEPCTVRAFLLAPLVRELGANGVNMDRFVRRYGLSRAQLTSLYDRVPVGHFVAIAEDASVRLDQPFL